MDNRFDDIFNSPDNEIFQVVFFPDRIYHSRYLNASISTRYRYDVTEVRSKSDITILKGGVYLDEVFLTHFLRIEYKASKLVETTRESGRTLRDKVMIENIKLVEHNISVASVTLNYSKQVQAYQSEIWETLEAPVGNQHDAKILNLMGKRGSITRLRPFSKPLKKIKSIITIEISFKEFDFDLPYGYKIAATSAAVDNNYLRSYQVPNQNNPTVAVNSYLISFQRGWYLDQKNIPPVTYNNPLMSADNPENRDDNVVNMRWILQRELGGNLIYFHEVELPPGNVEGTHQHLGSEELYYFYAGEGEVYMAVDDDPTTDGFPQTDRPIFQLDDQPCRILPATPGVVVYTKSGGFLGVKNTGTEALKFVAFAYHSN